MQALENRNRDKIISTFSKYYDLSQCIISTRATGLLASHLEYLKIQKKKNLVLLPSLSCSSLVHAVIAANCIPIFIDIKFPSAIIDIKIASNCITNKGNDILAIVAVHQFGEYYDFSQLKSMCELHDICLVEDLCQSMPLSTANASGDVLLFSFGHSKQLDAGAGAAIGIRKTKFNSKVIPITHKEYLLEFDIESTSIAESYRKEWYRHFAENPQSSDLTAIPEEFLKYKKYLLWGSSEINYSRIVKFLNDKNKLQSSRLRKYELFQEELKNLPNLHVPNIDKLTTPWRFNFLVSPSIRNALVDKIRARAVHASTWYRPLPELFPDYYEVCLNSRKFSDSIINLWISEQVNDDYVNECVATIKEIIF